MGQLKNGKWYDEWYEPDEKGHFVRSTTKFRNNITADGSIGFKAEAGRYHLYVSYACPWASRTLIMRSLKGLQNVISVSVVSPHMGKNGWEFSEFPGVIPDTVNNADYLWQVYTKAAPDISGRVTVPVLWDKQTGTIVNNESREIIRMLDLEFQGFAKNKEIFYTPELGAKIDETIDAIYNPVNNGVYRAGFATTQEAYQEGFNDLFNALDYWEEVLSKQRYLCGDKLTEADICMFPTLYRFDAVYYVHFKCNKKRIVDYPNLWNYVKDIYQHPGVRETCHMDHVKEHYYWSHDMINPHRIVPLGPDINFDEPHNRDNG